MRRALALLTIVLLAVGLGPPPARADRADDWRAVSQRALDQLNVLDTGGTQPVTVLAYAAQATAWLSSSGWEDPAALAFLTRMYALQNPDGGYGLNYAWDAHQDGTVNPANTSYTVTSAGYVAPVLLDAYRHNPAAVPRALVQQQFDLIATMPRIDTSAGRCISYSRHANDAQPGFCVHNVSAGAAGFLLEAGRYGFAVPWWIVMGIAARELSALNRTTRFWPYKDSTAPAPQDSDHNSYTIEGMYELAFPAAYSAAYVAMFAAPDGTAQAPIVYMRLTGLPPAPAAMSGSTTIWCVLGDQWRDESDAYVTANLTNIGRMSQAAYYAARASKVCA